MRIKRIFSNGRSELLSYLASLARTKESRVASLNELSQILNTSTASLREQLEVARVMGYVDIKPRRGITLQPYSLRPAIRQSVGFAVAIDPEAFYTFSDLRNHIEAAYWNQAVPLLTSEDHQKLTILVARANEKLDNHPIQIPQYEHRELHLLIFSRLNNPFVNGILEAYWELYEAVGFDMYTDYPYLKTVWGYHKKIVDAIIDGYYDLGYQALMEHTDLLQKRTKTNMNQLFE